MSLRVLSVFGTRPEAVKMAPVVRRLTQTPGIASRVCVTAQHRQMLDQVLHLFEIKPDYDLDLMREDQGLAELSAAIFTHLNRRVAGVAADLHFAPTEWTRRNLLREGVNDEQIAVTGNPVIDALQFVANQAEPEWVGELLERLGIEGGNPKTGSRTRDEGRKSLILVKAHRRENFGKPLDSVCHALQELAARNDVEIVYPVHLNPNVQEPVNRLLGDVKHVSLLPPLDYLPLIHLMKHARLILTDSGGIQEEAPAFGIPVLVLREVTERPEAVEAGTVKVVGTDKQHIVDEANCLLDDPAAYARMAQAANPYGDGHAAEKIVQALLDHPIT